MVLHQVCSIRRPRRMVIGLVLLALVLILIGYQQALQKRRERRAKLFLKPGQNVRNQHRYGGNRADAEWGEVDNRRQSFRQEEKSQEAVDDVEKSVKSDSRRGKEDSAKETLLRAGSNEHKSEDAMLSDESNKKVSRNNDDKFYDDQLVYDEQQSMIKKTKLKQLPEVEYAVQDAGELAGNLNQTIGDGDAESDKPLLLSSGRPSSGSFIGDLERVVGLNRIVVLSVVDSGYANMAVNFYRTSLVNVPLTNFLLVCTDHEAVKLLRREGIACTPYEVPPIQIPILQRQEAAGRLGENRLRQKRRNQLQSQNAKGASASDFGSEEYYIKSNAKTSVILVALQHGYNVLVVDVDVVMFKQPFSFFNCTTCDAHFQMDREMYNSGFAFIRSTPGSLKLYETAWSLFSKYHKAHDQIYLNMAINRLNPNEMLLGYSRRVSKLPAVRLQSLSVKLFPCGVYYFERHNRMFENLPPCNECVMAHNNYIGSVPAKIYRFKENLLWTIDTNQYYSNKSARYFTYDNPLDFGLNSIDMEIEALKSALAISMVSGRVLILPTFRCCSRNCRVKTPTIIGLADSPSANASNSRMECSGPHQRCSLLSVLKLKKFDRAFGGKYREHSFLRNKLVPDSIKLGVSPVTLFINVSDAPPAGKNHSYVVVTPADREQGATLSEVVRWLDERQNETVVRFHSLYGAAINWKSDASLGFKLKRYFEVGFECSTYEQWDADQLDLAKMWPENRRI